MRIGFVSTYPPIECGIGTYTEALNHALKPYQNETFVISQQGAQGENVFPLYDPRSESFAASLFYTAAGMTPDVVHIQHEYGLFGSQRGVEVIELLVRFQLTGLPAVTTLHTVYETLSSEEETILRYIVQASAAVIVHEAFQKETLVKYFGSDCASKIHVIEHGVREMQPVPNAKAKLDLEGQRVVLLCGYFRPSKGFHRLIELFPRIAERREDIAFVVAGKTRNIEFDAYRRELFVQLNESPVVDRIRIFRGQFPQYTFDSIVSAADVVVLPYEKGAQSGILSQCFAMQRPVVVSNLPAFEGVVERSGSGLVCENDDQYVENILRLLDDDALYRRCQQNIENYVETRAGWSQIAQKHIAVYHSVTDVPYGKARYVYFPEPTPSLTT